MANKKGFIEARDRLVKDAAEFFALTSLEVGRYVSKDGLAWDVSDIGPGDWSRGGKYVKVVQTGPYLNVKAFGAVGDGVTNDAPAISLAHAKGTKVFYPYGDYKHVGYFPECEGGIVGEGYGEGAAKKARITFYNCTDPKKAAIASKRIAPYSSVFEISNIGIRASSWDAVTGCLGYGVMVTAKVNLSNVRVYGFRKTNIFVVTLNFPGAAPYESLFENVGSYYSGEHGIMVGSGANAITFINPETFWNGCPAYMQKPTTPGDFDGFHVAVTSDGIDDVTPYWPEALTVIGGDASYNSRYGWNFDFIRNSSCIKPAYAELNLVKEARCGSGIRLCEISFGNLHRGEAGFLNELTYVQYDYSRVVRLGAKILHPNDVFELVSNTSLPDEIDGVVSNAPKRKIFLSRNNSASRTTFIDTNATPDGTAVDVSAGTVSTLRGFGAGSWIGIGAGARHMKIGSDTVILPDLYYQKTSTGWDAPHVKRGMVVGFPTTAAGTRGDILYERNPVAGGYVGYICVATGDPGTWKRFGAIET